MKSSRLGSSDPTKPISVSLDISSSTGTSQPSGVGAALLGSGASCGLPGVVIGFVAIDLKGVAGTGCVVELGVGFWAIDLKGVAGTCRVVAPSSPPAP